jgi:hypothetical protein
MSRAAAVYELSAGELLSAYGGTQQHDVMNLDRDVSPAMMDLIQTLAGCERSEVSACSLTTAYSHWLPDWVTRAPPQWHMNESRTVSFDRILPSFCAYCLFEDIQDGCSQYVRLSWYCALTTICPVHRTELFTCCAERITPTSAHVRHQRRWNRMRCIACRSVLGARNPDASSEAEVALAEFESILRNMISRRSVSDLRRRAHCLILAQDLAWALMRPVRGTPYRVAHFFKGPRFAMPFGFNTPVEVPDWLSCGSITLRRFLLSFVAALHYSDGSRESMALASKTHKQIWVELRSNLSERDAAELKSRAVHWDLAVRDELDFYWLRNRTSTG